MTMSVCPRLIAASINVAAPTATAPSRKASQRAGSTTIAVQMTATAKGRTAGANRDGRKVDQNVGSLKKLVSASTAVEIVRTAPGFGLVPARGRLDHRGDRGG